MRLKDIKLRAAHTEVLCGTLEDHLRLMWGRTYSVRAGAPGSTHAQKWLMQPTVGAYYTRDIAESGRTFLRAQMQFTPFPARAVPQFVAAQLLASKCALRFGREPIFIDPALDASQLLIFAGNRRLRIYDFSRKIARVVLKRGASRDAIKTEVEIRRSSPEVFLRIERFDLDQGWYEEPIYDGYCLSRVPPWFPRGKLAERALAGVESWGARTRRNRGASSYVSALVRRIFANLDVLDATYSRAMDRNFRQSIEALATVATRRGNITVSMVHGDFQLGNILVDRGGQSTRVIDCEFSSVRCTHYDRYVWQFGTRSGGNFPRRFQRELDSLASVDEHWGHEAEHASRIAACVLEDIEWFTTENRVEAFLTLNAGLRRYMNSAGALARALARR